MKEFNETEIQILKKICKNQDVFCQKLRNYENFAVDPQIKQLFNEEAKDEEEARNKIIDLLNE